MFTICLTPNSHQNPCLFWSTLSVFFHRARKMQFCKNWAPVQAGARFLRFRASGKAHEITHKITKKNNTFLAIDFIKNLEKSTKNKVSTSTSKKTSKISIFWSFWPPKSLPKPFRNRKKSMKNRRWKRMRKNRAKWSPRAPKTPPRACGEIEHAWHPPLPFETCSSKLGPESAGQTFLKQ